MFVLVVEAIIISISTPTTTGRAVVEVIIPTAIEVVIRATEEVIIQAVVEVVVAIATVVPTAGCTTPLHGARCTLAHVPSVRAAPTNIHIDAILPLAIDALDVGDRQLPFLGLLLQTHQAGVMPVHPPGGLHLTREAGAQVDQAHDLGD
jgi:hypothetical protein